MATTSSSEEESTKSTTTTTPNQLPPALVANLQSVLAARRPAPPALEEEEEEESDPVQGDADADATPEETAPVATDKTAVLVTSPHGIRSPGLAALVDALVFPGHFDVYVCAPDTDKSNSGHSVSIGETVSATSVDIFNGAKAFELSGTPVDSVSLALSGRLFSWSKPALVISGIDVGSNCGHDIFYSAGIAAAREALLCGVPALAISLIWKKDESKESDFKDAVDLCMPLINAAIRDAEKGFFPKQCFFNIGIPSALSAKKGFKLTRQSLCNSVQSWEVVSTSRPSAAAAHIMSLHQSLGLQLAQLGKDASAAGAARRINAQRKTVVVESVAAAGKPEYQEVVRKFFRAEFLHKEHENLDEDVDLRALEDGFVSVTPLHLHLDMDSEIQASASDWLSSVLAEGQEASTAA